ncbi:MAG TPA: hypothetical protein VGJ30_20930 [Candidatus Angelobacter sp.]|jgi:hypothetical protein
MRTVVLDGATLFSAAAIFERMREKLVARPINILSLSSLLDSYLSFEDAFADRKGWDRFVELAPPEWSAALAKFISPIDLDLSKYDGFLERFIKSETAFSVLNAQIFLETTSSVRSDFMTYVGRDFGVTPDESDEAQRIGELIRKNIAGWDYHASNQEHIDPIQAMWRGVAYQAFCAEHDYAFVPHELRARFQKSLAVLEGFKVGPSYVQKAITELRDQVRKRVDRPPALAPFDRQSIVMWEEIGWPLLSARIFQESKNIYDLFDRASVLRGEMREFRRLCHELDAHDDPADFRRKIKQLVDFFRELPKTEREPERSMSIGVSISPILEITPQIELSSRPRDARNNKCLSFMRDIYENLTLPYSFRDDVARIFGMVLWENTSQRTPH